MGDWLFKPQVSVANPAYRRPLSPKQIRLLEIIFKFRFVSVPSLASLLGKDRSSVYQNLYVLAEQGYLAKRYNKTYRLRGRPASYFLAAKGLRYLRDNSELNQAVLHNMYKSPGISEEHVDHCLLTIAVYHALHRQTNATFGVYSRYELAEYEFCPRPLPDLYLSRKQPEANRQSDYMLDIFEPQLPFWVMKQRIRAYQQQCDEADLPDYPHILLVAPNQRTEKKLLEIIENLVDDFELYTTTLERMLGAGDKSPSVWRAAFEEQISSL